MFVSKTYQRIKRVIARKMCLLDIINLIDHKGIIKKNLKWIFFKFFAARISLFNPNLLDDFMIVTGADSTHAKSLNQFLSSLLQYEPDIKVVAFDLGLTKHQRQHLENNFPTIEFRTFNYAQYPDYFNIKVNKGEYAWKPVIVSDILNEFKGCVCWMDAGNVITKPLFWLRVMTQKIGMYSPYSSGDIAKWTYPKTLQFLNCSNNLLYRRNLAAGCVAVRYENAQARNIINRWKECALIKDCIAPNGSSRKNHRQDQAVLSVLAYQSGIIQSGVVMYPVMYGFIYGIKFHQGINEATNKLLYPSSV